MFPMEGESYGVSDLVGDVISPITSSVPVLFAAIGGLVATVTLIWFGIKQVRKGASKA